MKIILESSAMQCFLDRCYKRKYTFKSSSWRTWRTTSRSGERAGDGCRSTESEVRKVHGNRKCCSYHRKEHQLWLGCCGGAGYQSLRGSRLSGRLSSLAIVVKEVGWEAWRLFCEKSCRFFCFSKIDGIKKPELLAETRWLGLRGYLRLRKWELHELIQITPILALPVLDINTPILRTSRYVRPRIERGEGDKQRREIRAIKETLGLQ